MTAEDFLDERKKRLFRVKFPDFVLYDDNPVLLDVNLHEVMSDNPDIEIGNLVIPELTLKTEYLDMTNHTEESILAETGLEQNQEDVTEEVTGIQKLLQCQCPIFARTAEKHWIVADGRNIYAVRMSESGTPELHDSRTLTHEISAMFLETGTITGHGNIYLSDRSGQYRTKLKYRTSMPVQYQIEFYDEPETTEITDEFQKAVLAGMSADVTYTTVSENQVYRLKTGYAGSYQNGVLCRHPVSASITEFTMKSYGDAVLKETITQDEETMEMLCYGILEKTVTKNAESFFTSLRIYQIDTLADLYQNFITWLNQEEISITAKNQEFLNLDDMPFIMPDSADMSGITAGQLLKEFALLEGGNARINHDNELELGWCSAEPVLTLSAEKLESMRIGTERLAGAEGIFDLNPDAQNQIQTAVRQEDMFLSRFTGTEAFTLACQRMITSFQNGFYLPFSVSALAGASPFVRTGDCIRIMSRSNFAVSVPVMIQEMQAFPFLKSRISMPEATDWTTIPVDFSGTRITGLIAENYPDFIIYGEIPDISDMIITARQPNGEEFTVPVQLCEFSTEFLEVYARITVSFAGQQKSSLTGIRYALYTADSQKLITADTNPLVAKEMN